MNRREIKTKIERRKDDADREIIIESQCNNTHEEESVIKKG